TIYSKKKFLLSEYANRFPVLKGLFEKIKDIPIEEKAEYKNQKYLFVISIDNEIISCLPDYSKIIEEELIWKHFEENHICSVCNQENVKSSSKIYVLKYYNTDKQGFSSGYRGDFKKNFSICGTCYKKSLIGRAFIKNYLSSKIGLLDFYIIPHFIVTSESAINLKKLVKPIKNIFNPAVNIDSIAFFEDRLKQFQKFEKMQNSFFILNFLFYRQNQAQFYIHRLIKDVLPSRMSDIALKTIEINMTYKKIDENSRTISISALYNILPLKKTKVKQQKDKVEQKYYLEIIESMLKEQRINEKEMVKKFAEGIKIIIHKQNEQYSLGNNKKDYIQNYVLDCNFFLLFLQKINNIRGDFLMSKRIIEFIQLLEERISYLNVKGEKYQLNAKKTEKIKNYLEEFKSVSSNEQKTGLVFLGYLLSEVAYAQSAKNLKKPILNKINFTGMNEKNVLKFSNIIYEKMVQYKLVDFNALFLYVKDQLITMNLENWQLSKDENVFYIMTGYSLGALFIKKEDNKDEIEGENEDNENNIDDDNENIDDEN
ncbi:MAG: type I-B CRISPR-associated protein Cas8b/Csh1, partial [Desulfobacterales bacterium]|nr:type I-B CRISPR-associated protein Cas8b/Csh1 [Desulfobacterales bacterium]